jgi:hypothetical protein
VTFPDGVRWPAMRRGWLALALSFAAACAPTRGALLVQVVSLDYDAAADVDRIVVEVRPESGGDALPIVPFTVTPTTTLARPTRVYSALDLPLGEYAGTISFFRGDLLTQPARPFHASVAGTTVFTALFSRLCEGVTCPGGGDARSIACLAGRCVPPECSEEHPELCPMPDCSATDPCASSTLACATSTCTASGACVEERDDTLCAADERCDAVSGCVPRALEAPELLAPLPGSYTQSVWAGAVHLVRIRWAPVLGANSYATSYALECPGGLPTCSPLSSFGQILPADTLSADHVFETTVEHETAPVGYRLYFSIRACTDTGGSVGCTESPWSYVEIGRVRGDYDGDGYADVAIGARGGVSVFHGSAAGIETTARTGIPITGEIFEMTSADLDGDGFGDLVVSAPEADATSGAVFYGGPGGLTVTSYPNLIASQPQSGADCCYPSYLGDLDDDGRADVALVARGFDAAPRMDVGAAFYFYGGAARPAAQSGWVMFGVEGGLPRDVVALAYARMAAAPHAMPASRDALWTGAPGAGGRITGQVIADRGFPASVVIDAATAMLDGAFGTALATGDFDGDGTIDLVASAPLVPPAGALVVLDGPTPTDWVRATSSSADVTSRFGETLVACDLDGDGDDELVIGAPGDGSSDSGVYYYDYEDGVLAPLSTIIGLSMAGGSDCTGVSCADVDGDGRASVVLGCAGLGVTGTVSVVNSDGDTEGTLAPPGNARFGSRIAR